VYVFAVVVGVELISELLFAVVVVLVPCEFV